MKRCFNNWLLRIGYCVLGNCVGRIAILNLSWVGLFVIGFFSGDYKLKDYGCRILSTQIRNTLYPSLRLPLHLPTLTILQLHAYRFEIVTDLVGEGEIAVEPCFLS